MTGVFRFDFFTDVYTVSGGYYCIKMINVPTFVVTDPTDVGNQLTWSKIIKIRMSSITLNRICLYLQFSSVNLVNK